MRTNSLAQPDTHPWLVDDIDTAKLQRIESLFRAHHSYRLADAQERLPGRAAQMLSALPLFLHTNHPSLPGYCGNQIPHGIVGFTPATDCLHAARQFTRGYRYRNSPMAGSIAAVYFMGSAGSVAQTRSSDLDIWVCLPEQQHALMDEKLSKLTQWAAGLGVELQCFAVDARQFTGGTELAFSPLLLDEFYRTACLLAGQYPLWWLIPPVDVQRYQQIARRLTEQKYVQPSRYLDFGPVTPFTVQELFAAGVRELERSVNTPHKSLLKLAVLESYHAGHVPLSQRYKEAVISGTAPQHIDSYLMLADHLDGYFSQQPQFSQRQAFMQRAWLTKTSRGNARLQKTPAWWDRARGWGYDPVQLNELRWPNDWPLQQIIIEHHRTIAAIVHALSFLGELERAGPGAKQHVQWAALRVRLVDMRLLLLQHTQYNDKLLDAIVPRSQTGNARIEPHGTSGWCLAENEQVLIQRPRLVQVLLWLKRQGLSLRSLQLAAAKSDRYRQIFTALQYQPCVALVNAQAVGITPADERGETLITTEADPLSYGANQLCLVKHVDLVHARQDGTSAVNHWMHLDKALCGILSHAHVTIIGIGDVRRSRIQQRLRALVEQARAHFAKRGSASYMFQLGSELCCLHKTAEGRINATNYATAQDCFRQAPPTDATLISRGGRLRAEFLQLADRDIFAQPVLLVIPHSSHVTLEYRDATAVASLHAPPRRHADFLQSLSLFTALLKQRGLAVPKLMQRLDSGEFAPVMYNGIDDRLRYRLAFRQLPRSWSIQCGQETWARRKIDQKLLNLIRRQVHKHRTSTEEYPIYLTDIELNQQDFLVHLRAKIALEAALSTGIGHHAVNMFRDPL